MAFVSQYFHMNLSCCRKKQFNGGEYKTDPFSLYSPAKWSENLSFSYYFLVQLLWWESQHLKMDPEVQKSVSFWYLDLYKYVLMVICRTSLQAVQSIEFQKKSLSVVGSYKERWSCWSHVYPEKQIGTSHRERALIIVSSRT